MRSLSFFTGLGGLAIGAEKAGFEAIAICDAPRAARRAHQSRSKAIDTYLLNRPGVAVYEGIESYDYPAEHYGIDLIEGGPPCQPFSVAGRKRGLSDPRGQLLLEYIELVCELRPKAFILENVPGLMLADGGRVVRAVLNRLVSVGYRIRVNRPNALHYGLAQDRKRVIAVGALGILPPPMRATHDRPATLGEAIGHMRTMTGTYVLPSPCVVEAIAQGKSKRLSWDKPAPTLMTKVGGNRRQPFVHPDLPRCLSIEELYVLQGLPKYWRLAGSVRDRYHQIGNAVPIPMAYAAARTARQALESIQ